MTARAQWPILTVAAIFVLALVLVAAGFWRRGALLTGQQQQGRFAYSSKAPHCLVSGGGQREPSGLALSLCRDPCAPSLLARGAARATRHERTT